MFVRVLRSVDTIAFESYEVMDEALIPDHMKTEFLKPGTILDIHIEAM